jgi:Glutathione S-transferase, N-terminal domain
MITLSAFRWVPPFAQGLVRDLRVRWALEEAGLPYQENLIGPEDQASIAYRALQPFGQVPAIETDEIRLFESGAIVLHIAEKSTALAPSDPIGRARTSAWVFAAVNSLEPAIVSLSRRQTMGGRAAAGGAGAGAEAPRRAAGLAGRPRLPRRPVHGGRPDDDHRAAHPPPQRCLVRLASAAGISAALRGTSRLSQGAGGPSATIPGGDGLTTRATGRQYGLTRAEHLHVRRRLRRPSEIGAVGQLPGPCQEAAPGVRSTRYRPRAT